MVLQIWLWESSTVPDIYLRELKYSHCLSSFFLCVRGGMGASWGMGWCGVWNTPFLLSCRNKSDWNKFHHFYYSNPSPPQFCKIRTVLLRLGTVPCGRQSRPQAQKSLWKAPLFWCFASSPGFLWESSTAWRLRLIGDRIYLRRQQNKTGLLQNLKKFAMPLIFIVKSRQNIMVYFAMREFKFLQ